MIFRITYRPLGDISDNIYVTTTLKVSNPNNVFTPNVYDFDKLFSPSGEPIKADDLTFSTRTVSFVPCDKALDITMTVNYEGALRVPGNENKNTGENALEYDDKVTFYKLENKSGGSLQFDKNLYCKNVYKIVAKDPSGESYVLKVAAPVPEELVVFVDDKPEVLLQWVREQLDNPVSTNLLTRKYKMYFENIRTKSKVYLVNVSISPAEILTLKSLNDVKAEKRLP